MLLTKEHQKAIMNLANEQAQDESLNAKPETIFEALLQKALKDLWFQIWLSPNYDESENKRSFICHDENGEILEELEKK